MLPRPPKPRRFQYHYRFSDPDKKAREQRIRFQRAEERRMEAAEEDDARFDTGAIRRRHRAQSNRRLAVILAVLIGLVVLVLLW